MKIGFITDSTCDIPSSLIKKHNIHILPIRVTCEHREILDDKTAQPYQRITGLLKRDLSIKSDPCSVEEIKDFFINLLMRNDYDHLVCIMPMKSRSESYVRTLDASIAARSEIRKQRQLKGWQPSVEIEVIDSTQISTGLGMILLNVIKAYEEHGTFARCIEATGKIVKYTQTYVLPNNLLNLYKQGSEKGDESVGLGTYLIGTALDIKPIILVHDNYSEAIDKIRGFDNALNHILEMLMKHISYNTIVGKTINISYGNTLKVLRAYPKYKEFENLAKSHDINILVSNMSATLNVNVGLGSIAFGFLAKKVIRNLD